MSKYGNKKTQMHGIMFDSQREAARYAQLVILERMGRIRGLERQVAYELAPSVRFEGVKRAKPALKYIADFAYWEGDKRIIEDVKSAATEKLAAFRIKMHLMASVHGLQIRIIK